MKKLLLSLGTVAAVAAPVASVIACSSTTTTAFKGTVEYTVDKTDESSATATIDFKDSDISEATLKLAADDLAGKFGLTTVSVAITVKAADKTEFTVTPDGNLGGEGEGHVAADSKVIVAAITGDAGWAAMTSDTPAEENKNATEAEIIAALAKIDGTDVDADIEKAVNALPGVTNAAVARKSTNVDEKLAWVDDDTITFDLGSDSKTATFAGTTWTIAAAPAAANATEAEIIVALAKIDGTDVDADIEKAVNALSGVTNAAVARKSTNVDEKLAWVDDDTITFDLGSDSKTATFAATAWTIA